MSAETHTPTRPRRIKREPVAVLSTVEMDRQRSTPWDELWHARSDRDATLVYEVRHAVEGDTWACQCVGFTSHGHCKHVNRCQRCRRVQWYHALWLGWGPTDLRRERQHYRDLEAGGYPLHEDDLAALDAITLLLGERERNVA